MAFFPGIVLLIFLGINGNFGQDPFQGLGLNDFSQFGQQGFPEFQQPQGQQGRGQGQGDFSQFPQQGYPQSQPQQASQGRQQGSRQPNGNIGPKINQSQKFPQSQFPGFQQPQQPGNFGQQQQQFVKSLFDVFKKLPGTNQGQGQGNPLFPNMASINKKISKGGFFFDLNPEFRAAVNELEQNLLGISDATSLAQMIQQLQDSPDLNRQVWLRGSMKAIINRQDMTDFKIPSLFDVSPCTVFPTEIIQDVQVQARRPQPERRCVVLNGSIGADNGPENTFWYFREDVMVNSHHWFWHLYYPMQPVNRPDRRGELFYYMHHSLLARYNAERLSNGFNRAIPFSLQRGATILEGYRPHMTDTDSAVSWSNRPSNTPLPDIITSFINLTMNDATIFRDRLIQGIDQGGLLSPSGTIPLNTLAGVDILGNTIEASVYNANPDFYGRLGLHNTGHVFVAFAVDPSGRIPPGIMSETATAMRDIIFYRWHAHVDDTVQRYKDRLAPYQPSGGELPLALPGVAVENVRVVSRVPNQPANQLRTFFISTTIQLANGLDFFRDPNAGSVPVCANHLDHEEFDYQITIRKDPQVAVNRAAVRIFLAPRFNEQGQRFSFLEQRRLFFALDTFSINLQNGPNTIVRQSIDSSLTISWPQSLQELNSDQNRTSVFCGCGWPHHLLLPRGTTNGMTYDLFVMVTSEPTGNIPFLNQVVDSSGCEISYLYCGVRNQSYPDAKPMNYPFDRLPYSIQSSSGPRMVQTLEEYAQGLPNVAISQVQIFHQGQQSSK